MFFLFIWSLIFIFPYSIQCHLHWSGFKFAGNKLAFNISTLHKDALSPSIIRLYHRNSHSRQFSNRNIPFRWPNFAPEDGAAIFEAGFVPFGPIGDWHQLGVANNALGKDAENVELIMAKMNWTEAERQLADRLFERWQFEDLLNFFYAKLLELPEAERNLAFSLLERYSPPKSLLQAFEAMTAEQKGHIQELVETGDRRSAGDLRKIARGIVASLPNEVQEQANRFFKMANYLFHFW